MIDIGKNKRCSGLTFWLLYRGSRMASFVAETFSLECLEKIHGLSALIKIQLALERLASKCENTKASYAELW